ncbi:MAG: fumarylacetoacetate hydrolase family protein [Xanthobacteraceae bacterium]|nr:fumarylacetoacetate hydrolase family protein [Xanthobacteraceae bacterium]MBX3523480.1 fumarylacetoacetate hydrolase family protein [Xanthobacteraceae bacterium]MBX3548315.1 fumarylacetoacetate hydrolase family protein [Xanthobacteraceae bacterium]MCW5675705.1 fumarylacetoacetate hydrolase family protein [Xanthobacteraceae bacterium]
MKIVRYGPAGKEKPGIIDKNGKLRSLAKIVADITPETLAAGAINKIKKAKIEKLPLVSGKPRLGSPVGNVRNFPAIGLNYADHAAEAGMPIPKEPIIFSKAPNCIVGPNDNVMIPKGSTKLDWEVEIAIVIGKRARYIEEKDAVKHIAGYAVCNDVSERAFQLEGTGQWLKGKCAETFGPLGPWLVTTDEIKNPQTLAMYLDVNGKRMQTGSTKTMIFSCAFIVAYVSKFMVLEPGDVITTGTPPGVGMGMKPPVFLKAGDVMTLGIEGLGDQKQKVVAFKK